MEQDQLEITVSINTEVEWRCKGPSIPFFVQFKSKLEPFKDDVFVEGKCTGLPSVVSSKKKYKYLIWADNDCLDPVIIIDEPPP
jgi:hypothetical protein